MGIAHFDQSKINVAVVTGGHGYDLPAFQSLWQSLPDVIAYPQHIEEFGGAGAEVQAAYDVIAFYNYTPTEGGPGYEPHVMQALERLGATPQGIMVLHHALLAYRDWPFWSEMMGVDNRKEWGWFSEQTIRVQIASASHPITEGLSDWEMVDETYTMPGGDEGSDILLAVDHPNCMKTLAWARSFRSARVFCFQSGHDATAYDHPMFREVIGRAVRWCAGK